MMIFSRARALSWPNLRERALHGDRAKAADSRLVGVVEEHQQEQRRRDDDRDAAHHRRLHDRPLGAVGEEQHVDEDDAGRDEENDPDRKWDHSFGAVDAVGAAVLPVGSLVEPLAVGRLLGRGAWLRRPQGTQHRQAPRVSQVAESAGLHPRPLLVDHGARIADEVTREPRSHSARQELRRLELLHDGPRLCLGAAARRVETLEGEEDDKSDQHGEAGGKDAEDPGRAIAVLEVAALGGASADEQHCRDRHCGDAEDDKACPHEIYRAITVSRVLRIVPPFP